MDLEKKIFLIPEGYSKAEYRGRIYGLSRSNFNKGKSTKVYAEELGGNDIISFNFYRTGNGNLLKTCEMPKEKVLAFLEGMRQS